RDDLPHGLYRVFRFFTGCGDLGVHFRNFSQRSARERADAGQPHALADGGGDHLCVSAAERAAGGWHHLPGFCRVYGAAAVLCMEIHARNKGEIAGTDWQAVCRDDHSGITMVSAEKNIQVVCFGEVLWDVLPTGKQPGGAPMNVAYHLNRLGISSAVISKVGSDADGRELLDMLRDIGVSPAFIQTDDRHATSRVVATIGGDNEVTYDIIAPVAWDFLVDEPRCSALVREAAVLVYGSLAARNRVSRDTLVQLLDHAAYRMFDVNLRAPHYTRETVDLLMRYADAVKLNGQELAVVSAWFGNTSGDENTAVGVLQDRYGLPEIIVTKGAAGASYYCSDARYDCPAIPVDVA